MHAAPRAWATFSSADSALLSPSTMLYALCSTLHRHIVQQPDAPVSYSSGSPTSSTSATRHSGESPWIVLAMASRPLKRPRHEGPTTCCWMDCRSITSVVSPEATVETVLASSTTADIFLVRLEKEILRPFGFSVSSQIRVYPDGLELHTIKAYRGILQQRVRVGLNEVGEELKKHVQGCLNAKPSLVVMTNDINPPATAAHIPLLCHIGNVPFLLLPLSSHVLGKLLGVRRASVMMFRTVDRGTSEQRVHDAVDSFVQFMTGKIPVVPSRDTWTTSDDASKAI